MSDERIDNYLAGLDTAADYAPEGGRPDDEQPINGDGDGYGDGYGNGDGNGYGDG